MLKAQQARCMSMFSREKWCSTNEDALIFLNEGVQQKCQSATRHPDYQSVILVSSYKRNEAQDASDRLCLSAYPSEKLKNKNISTILLNGNLDIATRNINNNLNSFTYHDIHGNSSLKSDSLSFVEPQISSVRGNRITTSKRAAKNKSTYSPPTIENNQKYKLSSSLPDVSNESAFNIKQAPSSSNKRTEKSKLKLRITNFVNKRSKAKKTPSEDKISIRSSLKRQFSIRSIEQSHSRNGFNNNPKTNIKTHPAKSSMMSISPRKKKIFYSERQSGIKNGAPSVPPSTPACMENETVGSLADLKSQRNIIQKLLKIGSKRREKEKEIQQKGKEQEKLRLEQEKKDLIASQRRQIYYLNEIMTKLENEKFLEFKAKQSGGPV